MDRFKNPLPPVLIVFVIGYFARIYELLCGNHFVFHGEALGINYLVSLYLVRSLVLDPSMKLTLTEIFIGVNMDGLYWVDLVFVGINMDG